MLGYNVIPSELALSLCVHGEQSAINHALIQGETGLQSLAINAAPCGYCRQFLYEITTAKTLNILPLKNCVPELPTFGAIAGFSLTGVQWKGLDLGRTFLYFKHFIQIK